MKLAKLTAVGIILVGCTWDVQAGDARIEDHPGYIDLEGIEMPDVCESVTDISLGPNLLRLVSKSKDGDGEDGSENLLLIRVKSFESDSFDVAKLEPVIERIEEKLKKEKWERIVHVVEGDERTTVSIKYDDERILGLLVMAIEPDNEITFVNIVGSFDFEDLGNFNLDLNDFDIDLGESALDSLHESMDD